jgi:hypothetical protein
MYASTACCLWGRGGSSIHTDARRPSLPALLALLQIVSSSYTAAAYLNSIGYKQHRLAAGQVPCVLLMGSTGMRDELEAVGLQVSCRAAAQHPDAACCCICMLLPFTAVAAAHWDELEAVGLQLGCLLQPSL